ncbi:single-stranded DNA-binding protein [Microbacterium esteraromaticum]|uniref:single-stranded DNA-binding protein n=1 Tax=Microbacterium esteraromaticum TaxID=57043 RepID=UPI0023678A5B|nr:single-stranded DNA-binding protein [Microbacterium esteraromaticum]WDH79003.1 single-stranded DNA-binding protein [Microbacterium esteraromaticum]
MNAPTECGKPSRLSRPHDIPRRTTNRRISNSTISWRHTQSGAEVASFTIASTPRTFDRQANEWKDGDALFLRCTAWRELATNITGSLTKGSRVIATGRLQQRSYQDRDGNNRISLELIIDEIGPSLRYATAQVTRAERSGGRPAGPVAAPAAVGASTDSWAAASDVPF